MIHSPAFQGLAMSTLSVSLSGYTDLPAGKIASIVTYLEMHERPVPRPVERPDLSLQRVADPEPHAYRALFRRIGADWLWFGRLEISDEALTEILRKPGNEIYRVIREGEPVGLLELDFADPADVELSYFGLVPEMLGGGAGRWLMNQALDLVWSRPQTRRFWVHTCTADSQKAVGFYRSSGFSAYKRAIEIADDPRLSGLLPEDVAPHVPLIGG